MSEFTEIVYSTDGPIADIMFNRPQALNAISPQLKDEVTAALALADKDKDIRVVIISGTPESRAFSAGYDISDKAYEGRDEEPPPEQGTDTYGWRTVIERSMRWEMAIWEYRKPIITQVHGYCLAGACELMMLSDLTIASDDAIFGEPEIRFMTGPPAMVMPWMIGIKRAKQLLFTGELIDAETAKDFGMINYVVPRDQLREETLKWARKFAVVPTEALHYTKSAINRGMEVGGLRNTVELGLELTSMLDATATDFGKEFHRRQEAEGLSKALAWSRAQFNAE